MSTLTARDARKHFYRLIDETAAFHAPLPITGKRNKAVLRSENDWSAIQATLYLLGIPGMRESIRDGMAASADDCDDTLDW